MKEDVNLYFLVKLSFFCRFALTCKMFARCAFPTKRYVENSSCQYLAAVLLLGCPLSSRRPVLLLSQALLALLESSVKINSVNGGRRATRLECNAVNHAQQIEPTAPLTTGICSFLTLCTLCPEKFQVKKFSTSALFLLNL